MSYTIAEDNGTIHVRAIISDVDELNELRDKLDKVVLALRRPDCPPVEKETPHAG